MFLNELRQGTSGVISRVGGDMRLRRRLMEMGLTCGTPFHIEKYAPLKDPMELVIKGMHVSLRVAEAAIIAVDEKNSSNSPECGPGQQ